MLDVCFLLYLRFTLVCSDLFVFAVLTAWVCWRLFILLFWCCVWLFGCSCVCCLLACVDVNLYLVYMWLILGFGVCRFCWCLFVVGGFAGVRFGGFGYFVVVFVLVA